MEGFRFTSSLTEEEYHHAQRLVAREKPAVFFFVYVWPKIGYVLGVIVAFAALMLQAGTGRGGSVGVTVAGALIGSALWLHYGTEHRISKYFRSAGLWHKMSVNADALGVSLDCEIGTKSHLPWDIFSRVLARNSVLVLMQTPDRFGVVSLRELDQSQREGLIAFTSRKVGRTDTKA
jgi:hypothetical protein